MKYNLLDTIHEIGLEAFPTELLTRQTIRHHVEDDYSIVLLCSGEDLEFSEVTTETELHNPPENPPVRGFSISGVYPRDEFRDFLCVSIDELEQYDFLSVDDYPVGYFRYTAIREEDRGQGIGFRLIVDMYNRLVQNTDLILTIVWEHEKNGTLRIMETTPQVEKLHSFSHYPLFDSQESCPICSGPETEPCACTFSLYGIQNATELPDSFIS